MEEGLSVSEVAKGFYRAFSEANAEAMLAFYHPDVVFSDPVFGILKGEQVFAMWRMLVRPGIDIQFDEPRVNGPIAYVSWKASYTYSPTGRKVINKVKAEMTIKNGRIVMHNDTFSLWRWSAMALGSTGLLLGWSSVVKRKITGMANANLRRFMEKQQNSNSA